MIEIDFYLTIEREEGGYRYKDIVLEILFGLYSSNKLSTRLNPNDLSLEAITRLLTKEDRIIESTSTTLLVS